MRGLGLGFLLLGLLALAPTTLGSLAAELWLEGIGLEEAVERRQPNRQDGTVPVETAAERARNLEPAWALDGSVQGGGLELPAPQGDFTLSFWYAPLDLKRPKNHHLINLLWMGQAEPLGTLASLWLDSQGGRLHLSTYAQALWLEPGYHQPGRPVWVVLVRRGGRFELYLDLVRQKVGSSRAAPKPVAPERLLLGRGFQPETGFVGLLGAPRLWERAFSPEEVAALSDRGLRAERWARALVWDSGLHRRMVWSAGFLLVLGLVFSFAPSLQMAAVILAWNLKQLRWSDRFKLTGFAAVLVLWYFL